MFGYGSLMDQASLKKTVPDAHAIVPAYIAGYSRDFSLCDQKGWIENESDTVGIPYCALNIRPTDAPEARVNGILFTMSQTNARELADREQAYQCVTTVAYDFETLAPLGSCWVFSGNLPTGAYDWG